MPWQGPRDERTKRWGCAGQCMTSRGYRQADHPAPAPPSFGFINTRSEYSITHSPYPNIMVRLSAVGFALTAASVLVPGVLSQSVPACAQTCATTAASASGCDLYVGFRSSVLGY